MSLKYAKRSQVIWFAILAAIKACNILFVAYMIKTLKYISFSQFQLFTRINGVGSFY